MKQMFTRGRIIWLGALLLIGFRGMAPAATLGLLDGNSSVAIDVDCQHGLFDWKVDGVNFAPVFGGGISDYRQWFWYRVGGNPERSIDTLTRTTTGLTDANFDGNPDTAFVRYLGAPGFRLEVTFTLVGGTPGSGTSDIGEQIRVVNTNATP